MLTIFFSMLAKHNYKSSILCMKRHFISANLRFRLNS
ncbi:hypothetical protein M770_00210 [Pseudomonas aeruginosa VRFPA03]|nr:hypothetical protein M770_00210 [Pseudomonas aeruginosa VRFPA03]